MWTGFLMLLLAASATGIGIIFISSILGKKQPDVVKYEPYECGVEPFMGVRERFSVHFYLVAIMFIMFDIEIVFLVPWAAELRNLFKLMGPQAIVEMLIFGVILFGGWIYIYRNRVLDWQ